MKIFEISKQSLTEAPLGSLLGNLAAKIQGMQQDAGVKKLADASLTQWQARVNNLQRANNNQPVADDEYKRNLLDFLDRVMLGGRYNYLDSTSKARIDPAVDAVMSARNDRNALQKAFQTLTITTVAARMQDQQIATAAKPIAAARMNPESAIKALTMLPAQMTSQQIKDTAQKLKQAGVNSVTRQQIVNAVGAVDAPGIATLLQSLGVTVS